MDKYLYTVSEEEKYYFDLRGYLVVRNALTPEEVGECNAAIDHFADQIAAYPGTLARDSSALQGTTSRQQLTGMLGWPPPLPRTLSPPAGPSHRRLAPQRIQRSGLSPRSRPPAHQLHRGDRRALPARLGRAF